MKNDKMLLAIGQIDDELIYGAVNDVKERKTNRLVRWMAAAACFCLVAVGVWNTLDRLDYDFFAAGCSAYPGEIVNGDYYYYVQHKGVMKYTPEGESEHLLHTYWFEEWDVNEYGIYYWWDMSVYVRDHKTGTRTKLYTANRADTTHIRFTLSGDGNVIVTHYNKHTEVTYEVLIDGRTGDVIDTIMQPTPRDVAWYAYYSNTNFLVGDRHIILTPVDERKNFFLVTENGQNLLPEGVTVSKYPEHFGDVLWFSIRYADGYNPAETDSYAVVYPDGKTEIVTIPAEYYYGGTTEHLFAVNSGEVFCAEVSTGDSWHLEMDAEADFHDLATDGVYLYTTAPWDHVQTCWKLIYDDSGRPTGLTLISRDITPE